MFSTYRILMLAAVFSPLSQTEWAQARLLQPFKKGLQPIKVIPRALSSARVLVALTSSALSSAIKKL